MKLLLIKAKQELKEIFLTWQGWVSWFIANVFTSLHWVVLIVIGFMTRDPAWYGYAAGAWAIGMSPFVPLWLFNIIIATFIKNLLFNKKRAIVIKGE